LVEKKFFTRIVDNLLSNASKYNKQKGKVSVIFNERQKSLEIIDTGKGIKNPKRVFERFYKEHERGVGIGLHIVKKLCDELEIVIYLDTVLGEGTVVKLELQNIINTP
jgi:signal transduction histidine kinase